MLAPGNADHVQQFLCAAACGAARQQAMGQQRLADRLAYAEPRIERRPGILENELGLPPKVLPSRSAKRGNLLPTKANAAAGGCEQSEQAVQQGGFAATGFTHQRDCFAWKDAERDAGEGADRLLAGGTGGKVQLEIGHGKERGFRARLEQLHEKIPQTEV